MATTDDDERVGRNHGSTTALASEHNESVWFRDALPLDAELCRSHSMIKDLRRITRGERNLAPPKKIVEQIPIVLN